MRCARVKFVDRSDVLLRKNVTRHICRKYNEEEQLASLSSKCKSNYEDRQPYLTILNLILPRDAVTLANKNHNSDRWSTKRARLRVRTSISKSLTSSLQQGNRPSFSCDDTIYDKNISSIIDNDLLETDTASDIYQSDDDEEIDPDIQKLLEGCQKWEEGPVCTCGQDKHQNKNENYDEENKRIRRKEKKKLKKLREAPNDNESNKSSAKTKGKRTIKMSLSKAPSPETIQIIRVDVTSNYSIDDGDEYPVLETTRSVKSNKSFADIKQTTVVPATAEAAAMTDFSCRRIDNKSTSNKILLYDTSSTTNTTLCNNNNNNRRTMTKRIRKQVKSQREKQITIQCEKKQLMGRA